ncbi:esterase/lipase family protein [Couchioplanes azureus]|uniref:esterase/lipase family protein n=1 Tax=Couchioplanes caeruleus TaxID=56438 RepID=UPI0016706D1B|nr:lipase [Couchioplanes caeruleus]
MPARRSLLIGVGSAVALVLLVLAAFRLVADDRPTARADQASPGPVLLVPGYGGSRASLAPLAERLTADGRRATVLTLPDGGTGDLLRQAAVLDEAVRRELGDGAPSVDVVGFSAGGVVARIWIDRYEGEVVARRVVSLGSPLHGTRLAAAGAAFARDECPTACRQLATGSDLLDELADAPLPERLPWLSVWTEDDRTVQPPDSARLDGAVNVALQDLCPGARVAHGELPGNPLVVALVMRALGPAALTAPAGCPAPAGG